jgi:hypothetical protein
VNRRTVFVLRMRAGEDIDAIRALRAWLKRGLRDYGLVCVEAYLVDDQQRRTTMDVRKYSAGPIKPDDVRDGSRVDKIINIYVHDKYKQVVLELESGDTFILNATNSKILSKAWGHESDDWLKQELEFSLAHYKDWNTDPPEEKETVRVKAISPAKEKTQNGGGAIVPVPQSFAPQRDAMDDEIPFATSVGVF